MPTDTEDLEKGLGPTTVRSAIPSWASYTPDNARVNEPIGQTPLQLFQLLVGIYTPSNLTHSSNHLGSATKANSNQPRAGNVGLYQRAKDQERASRLAYQATNFISNALYMFQILLAATFTALSAYKETHPVTLTVLGAVNTVLAGSVLSKLYMDYS
jgi:hypothetical protein